MLEEGITAIPDNAMMDNAALEKVVIPRSVTSLGANAFSYLTGAALSALLSALS